MTQDHGWISETAQRLEEQLDAVRVSPPPNSPILGSDGAIRPPHGVRQEIEDE